jgi:multiple sugar transport system ATP-binding protein
MANLVLKNLRGAELQRGLDLTVADREFVVLAGPNAQESTAIVRLIAGLAEPSEGDMVFDDRHINDLAPKERDIAFLSHDYEPYPGLSIYENLAIGLKRRQFAETEIKKRIASVAEALEIQNRLAAAAGSLSRAERPFVGLARAMVRQPRIYLFDRPFANLGPLQAGRGRAAIAGLKQRSSSTIIYATGDPAEALALGARTVIIAGSAVEQDADAQTVYDSPANLAVAKFFGEPPMNLVQGAVKRERDGIAFVEAGEGTISVGLPSPRFDAAMDLAGKPAILGFRPESVQIAPSEGSNRPGSGFRGVVDRVEPRGAGADVYLRTGAHELICRSVRWEEGGGRRLQFAIDLEKACLFDAETGSRATRDR